MPYFATIFFTDQDEDEARATLDSINEWLLTSDLSAAIDDTSLEAVNG